MTGVESVKYRKAFLEIIDERARIVHNLTLGPWRPVGIVGHRARLEHDPAGHLREAADHTDDGAGRGNRRHSSGMPFLLEGITQGLLGGVLAAGILYVLLSYGVRIVSPDLPELLRIEPMYYGAVVLAGALLGWIGSSISVLRFIRPPGH